MVVVTRASRLRGCSQGELSTVSAFVGGQDQPWVREVFFSAGNRTRNASQSGSRAPRVRRDPVWPRDHAQCCLKVEFRMQLNMIAPTFTLK